MQGLKNGKSVLVNWFVFGGWALKPDILAPVFGTESVFIDANAILPLLIKNNVLFGNWQQRLIETISPNPALLKKPFGIAGWSTGAMLAWAVAEKLKPAAGVFLSATPSFCRRRESGFLFGQRSSVLRSMREQLLTDSEGVVNKFCEQCGILDNRSLRSILRQAPCSAKALRNGEQGEPGTDDRTYNLSIDQLIAGLNFLEQTTLLPVKKASFPALFLHGKGDSIIPIDAGRYFCKEVAGTFAEFSGPHAFFRDSPDEPRRTINDFLQKVL